MTTIIKIALAAVLLTATVQAGRAADAGSSCCTSVVFMGRDYEFRGHNTQFRSGASLTGFVRLR